MATAHGVPLRALLPALEALAPLADAEDWDNVGLLVGDREQAIRRVLVCNDWDAAGLVEARAQGPLSDTLVLSYHPPWFSPLKRLLADGAQAVLHATIAAGAAVYSMHTALDAAVGGTAEVLAEAAGIAHAQPIVPAAPQPGRPLTGQGRMGPLATPAAFTQWLANTKACVGTANVLCVPPPAAPSPAQVRQVAVAPGAGRSLWRAARKQGADVLVTGELPHHDALAARHAGLAVVCLLHSVSERLALASLVTRLRAAAPGIHVARVAADTDPFTFA